MEGINGLGVKQVKDGLHGIAAMARSTNRTAEDGDPRITVPTERVESRDLSEPRELSLEEVLKSYEQPINEEQAWAVCYQCCSGLTVPRPPAAGVSPVKGPSSILLHRDGTVSLRTQHSSGRAHCLLESQPAQTQTLRIKSTFEQCGFLVKSKFVFTVWLFWGI